MKRFLFTLMLVLSLISLSNSSWAANRGLLVGDLRSILTDSAAQANFVSFVQQKGFTELQLYTGGPVDTVRVLPGYESQLSDLIVKMRANGFKSIIAAAGSTDEVDRVLKFQKRTDLKGKIDGFWIECEYWNNKPRDFAHLLSIVDYMKKVAPTLTRGIYLGAPLTAEVSQIAKRVNRIFLHYYVDDPNKAEKYRHDRLVDFGNLHMGLKVTPIFSAEWDPIDICRLGKAAPGYYDNRCFMGPWLKANGLDSAERTFLDSYNADTGSWKSGIQLQGFYYYSYKYLSK